MTRALLGQNLFTSEKSTTSKTPSPPHLSCSVLQCVHTSGVRDSLAKDTIGVMVSLTACRVVIGSNSPTANNRSPHVSMNCTFINMKCPPINLGTSLNSSDGLGDWLNQPHSHFFVVPSPPSLPPLMECRDLAALRRDVSTRSGRSCLGTCGQGGQPYRPRFLFTGAARGSSNFPGLCSPKDVRSAPLSLQQMERGRSAVGVTERLAQCNEGDNDSTSGRNCLPVSAECPCQ